MFTENLAQSRNIQSTSEYLICYSPFWEHEWREKVTSSKMSVAEINSLRSKSLVPGIKNDEVRILGTENISYLPIILIQNPGNQSAEKHLGKFKLLTFIEQQKSHYCVLDI